VIALHLFFPFSDEIEIADATPLPFGRDELRFFSFLPQSKAHFFSDGSLASDDHIWGAPSS